MPTGLDTLVHKALAVKAIGDPSEGRVGGYLVVWGSPQQRDLQNEYFTPETELGLDWYDRRPSLYHHGLDGTMQSTVIGVIDTLKTDQTGVWAEAQLNMRDRYVQAVMGLVNKGALGWSSGSLPHLVQVAADGRIKRWPIVEGSLTPTPAEPRQTEIRAIKAMYTGLGLDPSRLQIPEEPSGTDAKEPPAKEQMDTRSSTDLIHPDGGTEQKALETAQPEVTPTMDLQAVLSAILTAIQQTSPDFQISPEQSAQILATAQQQLAGQPTATMSAEQIGAAAGPIIGKAFTDLKTEHLRSQEAIKTAATNAAAAFVKSVQPVPPVAAFSGNGGNGQNVQIDARQNPEIKMRTKYADLNAEDMDFYIQFRNANRKRAGRPAWTPDSAFMRELSDKAGKSYEKGEIKLGDKDETARAIKSFNALKANELDYSTLATGGDEWVPDLWASQVWDKARLDNVIAPLFQNVEMPSNPFELPVQSSDPTVYYVAETKDENTLLLSSSSSPIPDSKMATTKVTLTASKLALRSMFSSELEEDSIIPWTSQLRKQSLRAIEDAIDNVLLNGDTTLTASTNINLIDGTPGGTEKYLAFKGLRYLPIITTTGNKVDMGGLAVTLAKIRQARFTLDRAYSANPKNLTLITHSEMYATLLGLTEFITMDKAGPQATAQTGQIGFIDGMPVVVSNEFALTDSAGKIPSGGGTLGSLVIAYNPGWYMGYRRKVNATIDFLSYYDAYVQTATVRLAFINRDGEVASMVYNALV